MIVVRLFAMIRLTRLCRREILPVSDWCCERRSILVRYYMARSFGNNGIASTEVGTCMHGSCSRSDDVSIWLFAAGIRSVPPAFHQHECFASVSRCCVEALCRGAVSRCCNLSCSPRLRRPDPPRVSTSWLTEDRIPLDCQRREHPAEYLQTFEKEQPCFTFRSSHSKSRAKVRHTSPMPYPTQSDIAAAVEEPRLGH